MSDKKAKQKKRILRYLLMFALCWCVTFTLYTNRTFALVGESNAARQDQSEAAWLNTTGGELSYGTFAEAVEKVSANGLVILRSDVALTEGITVSKSMTITSWYADAPCTIKNTAADSNDGKDTGRIFTVNGGPLFLQNIILDGGKTEGISAHHPLICINNVGVALNNGAVLQNNENVSQSSCGGGVTVRCGQLLMDNGSVITNCKARHGGGVYVNSKDRNYQRAVFGMKDGKIENCEASDGGGVYVNIGMFQMPGGEITGSHALGETLRSGGGAVYVAGESATAAVLIAGGTISGNSAVSNGGGILVNGGYTLLQINGGTLENNSAKTGGGVTVLFGTMNLFGGTVTNNTAELYGGGVLCSPTSVINLQGAPKVFDNTSGKGFDNLYLDGNEDTDPTSPINLVGPLTDGVKLGLSRWIRPDDNAHPYRKMIVPGGGYTIAQSDFDRLCCDRDAEKKEIYADDTEKYAFIPYNNEIIMVLAVNIELDKNRLTFDGASDPSASITATVTPDNAPEKGVIWNSSDENVAAVDENGNVTPKGNGKAIITAVTKSPYHASASCNVTVNCYQLTTKAEHGTITCMPVEPDKYFLSGETVKLTIIADEEYRLSSLKVYRTDDISVEVPIGDDNTLTMPSCDVTAEAVFEPIPYLIEYDLDGGALKEGETNPVSYTVESGEITLNNPVKSGYIFSGWTGTGLTKPELVVKIPTGSTGARKYTAVWKEVPAIESTPSESTSSNTLDDTSSDILDSTSSDTSFNSSDNFSSDTSDITSSDTSDSILDSTSNNSLDANSSNDEGSHIPNESSAPSGGDNPATGIAVSIIPLAAILSGVVAAVNSKKK